MYFCKKCQEENKWPEGLVKSHGKCEVCGITTQCNDIPSSQLPNIKKENENELKWKYIEGDDIWKASFYSLFPTGNIDGEYQPWFMLFGKKYFNFKITGNVEDMKKYIQDFHDFILLCKEVNKNGEESSSG